MTTAQSDINYKQARISITLIRTLISVIFKSKNYILVAGKPACEQGLVYVKIFAVLIFAGSSMSTLTAKFKGYLFIF